LAGQHLHNQTQSTHVKVTFQPGKFSASREVGVVPALTHSLTHSLTESINQPINQSINQYLINGAGIWTSGQSGRFRQWWPLYIWMYTPALWVFLGRENALYKTLICLFTWS
jgi:hypothetical protein